MRSMRSKGCKQIPIISNFVLKKIVPWCLRSFVFQKTSCLRAFVFRKRSKGSISSMRSKGWKQIPFISKLVFKKTSGLRVFVSCQEIILVENLFKRLEASSLFCFKNLFNILKIMNFRLLKLPSPLGEGLGKGAFPKQKSRLSKPAFNFLKIDFIV